jgi:hypothetical protein
VVVEVVVMYCLLHLDDLVDLVAVDRVLLMELLELEVEPQQVLLLQLKDMMVVRVNLVHMQHMDMPQGAVVVLEELETQVVL